MSGESDQCSCSPARRKRNLLRNQVAPNPETLSPTPETQHPQVYKGNISEIVVLRTTERSFKDSRVQDS